MNRRGIRVSGTAQTIGATAATACSFALVDGQSYQISVRIVGRDLNGDTIAAQRSASARRVATVSALVDVVVVLASSIDVALIGALMTVDVSSDTLRVRVTGVALKTIDWWAEIDAIEWSP